MTGCRQDSDKKRCRTGWRLCRTRLELSFVPQISSNVQIFRQILRGRLVRSKTHIKRGPQELEYRSRWSFQTGYIYNYIYIYYLCISLYIVYKAYNNHKTFCLLMLNPICEACLCLKANPAARFLQRIGHDWQEPQERRA